MKYTITFGFHEKPPFEILTPADNASLEVGQVAFAFLKVDCGSEGSAGNFLKMFRSIGNKQVDVLSILQLEQADMREFIETVLLVPSDGWAEKLPPSRRLAVFHHQSPRLKRIQRHFQGIAMRPTTTTRPEAWAGLNPKKPLDKQSNRFRRTLEEWNDAWESRESQPGLFRSILAKWETLAWRYETDDLLAIAWLELYLLAEQDLAVKLCRKCEKHFVPWPSNVLYCRKCRQNTSRQRLYQQIRRELMTKEEKEAEKRRRREYMRRYRMRKAVDRLRA